MSIIRTTLAGFLLLATSVDACRATYYAFSLDDDAFTIAIDSRIGDTSASGTAYRDDACKLRLLAENVVMFAEGIAGNNDQRSARFDIFVEADTAFSRGGSLEDIAARWATSLIPMFESLFPVYRDLILKRHDGEMVNGYFAGIAANGQIKVIRASIILRGQKFSSSIHRLANNPLTAGGLAPELQEFLTGTTPRASASRSTRVKVVTEFASKNKQDAQAYELSDLVRTVPEWARDEASGGPIASLTIERSTGSLRWVNQPHHCKPLPNNPH